MLFVIILSTSVIAFETPLNDPDSAVYLVIFYLDVFSTVLFAAEALMKTIAFGFILNGEQSYILSPWNAFDFIMIILTIIGLVGYVTMRNATGLSLQMFKYIRLIRSFRPLRLISHNRGFKAAMQTLLRALPNIINATIISMLFFLIFGIIGVNYFKGTFARCTEIPSWFNGKLV